MAAGEMLRGMMRQVHLNPPHSDDRTSSFRVLEPTKEALALTSECREDEARVLTQRERLALAHGDAWSCGLPRRFKSSGVIDREKDQ